jgi:excisionase family DNA binding protein
MTSGTPVPATADTLWTVDDVVRYLKVSPTWVYARANRGDIPSARRVGGLWRFDKPAIEAYGRGDVRPLPRIIALPKRGV